MVKPVKAKTSKKKIDEWTYLYGRDWYKEIIENPLPQMIFSWSSLSD